MIEKILSKVIKKRKRKNLKHFQEPQKDKINISKESNTESEQVSD